MLPIIFYNNFIPKLFKYAGITLYPFIFLNMSKKEALKTHMLHHELIHFDQIKKQGFFKFYFTYLIDFFKLYQKSKNKFYAYRNIPAEKEAYLNQWEYKLPKKLIEFSKD